MSDSQCSLNEGMMENSCQKLPSFLCRDCIPDRRLDTLCGGFSESSRSCRGHVACTAKYKRHACLLACVLSWFHLRMRTRLRYQAAHLPAVKTYKRLQNAHIRGEDQIKVVNYMVKSSGIINEFALLCQENKNYEHAFPADGFMLRRTCLD
jgi:hypothetical protein